MASAGAMRQLRPLRQLGGLLEELGVLNRSWEPGRALAKDEWASEAAWRALLEMEMTEKISEKETVFPICGGSISLRPLMDRCPRSVRKLATAHTIWGKISLFSHSRSFFHSVLNRFYFVFEWKKLVACSVPDMSTS